MIRDDLFIEVEIIDSNNGQVVRVFDDYFPVIFSEETDWHVHVQLPMENGAHLRFVVNPSFARASLWVDHLPANVVQGMITVVSGGGWHEDATEASDLRMWLRQLGRIPLAGSRGSLQVFA